MHSKIFQLSIIACSLGLAAPAFGQPSNQNEMFGQVRIDPSKPDQMKSLIQALQNINRPSDFYTQVDSPKWICAQIGRRTSPDGKFVAIIQNENLVVSNAKDSATIKTIKAEKAERNPTNRGRINDISWSGDSKKLLYGGVNGAHIYNVETGEITPVGDQNFQVTSCSWSPAEKYIALMTGLNPFENYNKELQILDSHNLKLLYKQSAIGNNSVAWSPDGNYLAFGIGKGVHYIVDTQKYFAKSEIAVARNGVLCWSPDSKYLAIADPFSGITIYSTSTWKAVQKIDRKGFTNLAWSKDGKFMMGESREPGLMFSMFELKRNAAQTDLAIEEIPPPKPGDADYMPANLEECYSHFDKMLPRAVRASILEMAVPSEVIRFHHGLGTFLRNTLGLWSGSTFSDYINKNTKERHPDEISNNLLRGYWYHLQGEKHDIFADMNKDKNQKVELNEPINGPMIDQRRVVYSGLSKIKEAGLPIDDYFEGFGKIEELVKSKAPESEISDKLEKLRKSYSKQIGRIGRLVDQLYEDGPLSKMCRQIESSLRESWKENKAFNQDVWLFCYVQPDGTLSNIETDDPKRYGPAVCTRAIKALASIKLDSPSKTPIPLVVTLNNVPEKTQVYVRHLNFSPYWYVFDTKVINYWRSSNLGDDGQVDVRMKVYRDGTIRDLVISKSSGDKEFDKKILETMGKAPSMGHFPDGGHEFSEVEQTWGYR